MKARDCYDAAATFVRFIGVYIWARLSIAIVAVVAFHPVIVVQLPHVRTAALYDMIRIDSH